MFKRMPLQLISVSDGGRHRSVRAIMGSSRKIGFEDDTSQPDDVEAFFTTDLDDDYDPELRFAATDNGEEHEPHQAQLREIADMT
jgi:hypothetical protein